MNHSKITKTLVFSTLASIIAINLCVALFYILLKPLDPDEFQHTHIAWNMFNGKILYKDFWEHHGPIYAFINYALFKAFDLQPHFDVFYFLRGISFIYFSLILFFTYKISRVVFKELIPALISVAVLSSCYFFQLKGLEIRPDTLQNVFWFAGLYVLMASLPTLQGRGYFIAGILFGLMVHTNSKSFFGLAFVGLFLCIDLYFSRVNRKQHAKGIAQLAAGFISVFFLVSCYFLSVGGFGDFILNNYLFNFVEISRDTNMWLFPLFAHIFITEQFVLVAFFILGALLLSRNVSLEYDRQKAFFLMVTLGSVGVILIGLFSQFFLLFLPLVAIVVGYAFVSLNSFFKEKWKLFGYLICIALFFVPMEYTLVNELHTMATEPEESLLGSMHADARTIGEQKEIVDFILAETTRSESIGYFWNACGAFTFNEDVQYYWNYSQLHGDTYEFFLGYDAYGKTYVDALQKKNVEYINASLYEIDTLRAQDTREYILRNYYWVSPCLLKKL